MSLRKQILKDVGSHLILKVCSFKGVPTNLMTAMHPYGKVFQQAVDKVSTPGSASQSNGLPRHMAYGGSRKLNQRFAYSIYSGAGFCEFAQDYVPTDEQFFQKLSAVEGVKHVRWQTSKTSQGNASDNHHFQHNILVTSALPGAASHCIEFELTRNNHMTDVRVPFTVTACFKEPTPHLIPEAWRILTAVVGNKALIPQRFREAKNNTLWRYDNGLLNCQNRPGDDSLVSDVAVQAVEHTEPPRSCSLPDHVHSLPPARPVPVPAVNQTDLQGTAGGHNTLIRLPATDVPVLPMDHSERPSTASHWITEPLSPGDWLSPLGNPADPASSMSQTIDPVDSAGEISQGCGEDSGPHWNIADSEHVDVNAIRLEDVTHVQMTQQFDDQLNLPCAEASGDAGWMAEIAVLIDIEAEKEAMLPWVLNRQNQNWTAGSSALRRVQAMKAREVEHVRFRSAKPTAHDAELASVVSDMRRSARLCIEPRVDIGDLSTAMSPANFLHARHRAGLAINALKANNHEGERLRAEYAELLRSLPPGTAEKVGSDQLSTNLGTGMAISQIQRKHTGEIVELDRTTSSWKLYDLASGSANVFSTSRQWYCQKDQQAVDTPKDPDWGYPVGHDAHRRMNEEIQRVCRQNPRVSYAKLLPDWKAQTLRTVVPCVSTTDFEWRRTGQVVTLGELFMALGKSWSATAIYYFYRCLRIVATKRQKDSTAGTSLPGSASGLAGTTSTSLQPSNMHKQLQTNKAELVKEYAQIFQLGNVDENNPDLFREALRYLQACLLADMRPPWADYKYPQALPGGGTLAELMSPCFLHWSRSDAEVLLGHEVWRRLHKRAQNVSLEAVGILARPLYVCTSKPYEKTPMRFCMNTAGMSPLMELTGERKAYQCARCAAKEANAQALLNFSPSIVPLRVLQLYVTVAAADNAPTPLRMKPQTVVLTAPTPSFAWGQNREVIDTASMQPAEPCIRQITPDIKAFSYNATDSKALWCSAAAFRGEPGPASTQSETGDIA